MRKNTNTQVWKEEERERVAAEDGSAKHTDKWKEAANQREMKLWIVTCKEIWELVP